MCPLNVVMTAEGLEFFDGYQMAFLICGCDNSVYLLIGLDHYWDFARGPVKRMKVGPTAAIFSEVWDC